MYSADTVFFIGKRQVKDGTELQGYEFILKAEKSRMVKEKSAFPIVVKFDGGIDPYSGLLEMALELGFVVKPKVGWHQRQFIQDGQHVKEEKSWRAKDTSCPEFWAPLFKHDPFRKAIESRYQLGAIESNAEVDAEVDKLIGSKTSDSVSGVKFGQAESAADKEQQLEDFGDDE